MLHWFWQAKDLGFCDRTRLCQLTVVQQVKRFKVSVTFHSSLFLFPLRVLIEHGTRSA